MSDHTVQPVTFNNKWVSMFQYRCLDVVYSVVLLLDSTWPKIMMFCGFVTLKVKLKLLTCFATRDSSGVTMKNLCLALALLEMPPSPARTFISLFRCSQAWFSPMGTKGMSFFVTEMLPPPT